MVVDSTSTQSTPSRVSAGDTTATDGSTSTSPLSTRAVVSPEMTVPVGVPVSPRTPRPTATAFADGITPIRRSERFVVAADGASMTDEDSLKKAMRLKAARNLDSLGTDMKSKSFHFRLFQLSLSLIV